jgi:hypothetical protein
MVEKMLQLLALSCRHRRITQPFTASTASVTSRSASWEPVGVGPSHYVVCLDCGRKFTYDWNEMRIVKTARVS